MRGIKRVLSSYNIDISSCDFYEHERSGRNQIYVMTEDNGKAWLIKRNRVVMHSESWFYRCHGSKFSFLPTCLIADPKEKLVVIELLPRTQTFHAISTTNIRDALALVPEIAAPLARLHSVKIVDNSCPRASLPLPEIDPVDLHTWLQATPATREFIVRLQASSILNNALQMSLNGDGPRSFLHGDIKLDNILWDAETKSLYLIDWELCGTGPSGWDLASVLGSLVLLWSDCLALEPGSSVGAWIKGGAIPLDDLYDAVCMFMLQYLAIAKTNGMALPSRDTLAAYIAAWLISRTWAETSHALTLSAFQVLRLVIAESIVRSPNKLFGALVW